MCSLVAQAIDAAGSASGGAGIGFDFNNPRAADGGGAGGKLPWDATAHNVTGFQFDIDTPPVGGQMRIEFPTSTALGTTDVNASYWGGATANLSPFSKGGTFKFHWNDVGGPSNLTPPPPFDATKILSMQFHVVSNTTAAVPFSYCISHVYPLQD